MAFLIQILLGLFQLATEGVTGKNIPNCEMPNAGANFKLQYSLQGENLNLTVFSDTRTYTKQ